MIKIENVVLPSKEQWDAVIRGMRNPLNSWGRSDSSATWDGDITLGENDFGLMKRLCKAGTEHRKFMRMIPVYIDITAPLYWWKELDTYKIGTVANSCSTMHKITAKRFTLEDFSCERMYLESLNILEITIDHLNKLRNIYLNGGILDAEGATVLSEAKNKDIWYQMIQLLPSSYNQKRTLMLNYEVLANMYHQRKHHKLDEWREFCKWVEALPYSQLITGKWDDESED